MGIPFVCLHSLYVCACVSDKGRARTICVKHIAGIIIHLPLSLFIQNVSLCVYVFVKVAADVSFNVEDGLTTGWWMRGEMEKYPQLRPLVLVLKYFLSQVSEEDIVVSLDD
jgi:DNA polymerase sigma